MAPKIAYEIIALRKQQTELRVDASAGEPNVESAVGTLAARCAM
jgi:hypothetical protein